MPCFLHTGSLDPCWTSSRTPHLCWDDVSREDGGTHTVIQGCKGCSVDRVVSQGLCLRTSHSGLQFLSLNDTSLPQGFTVSKQEAPLSFQASFCSYPIPSPVLALQTDKCSELSNTTVLSWEVEYIQSRAPEPHIHTQTACQDRDNIYQRNMLCPGKSNSNY